MLKSKFLRVFIVALMSCFTLNVHAVSAYDDNYQPGIKLPLAEAMGVYGTRDELCNYAITSGWLEGSEYYTSGHAVYELDHGVNWWGINQCETNTGGSFRFILVCKLGYSINYINGLCYLQ